ncbi:MAG TPA: TetR/AcrR family transcriptional regulator [Solirubrobacterales bacterium]|jgi:AcrR family transcriptional regulator|nr:TetR/AcrR family transcriptional regulator [Solirubrobacterales bacterium]
MGRPPRYDADSLLDAALALAAAQGPGAVTMSAVINSVGAPSGSLYHRFPNRPALLAALWLRTLERFQAGFLEAAADEDGEAAALAAARHTIEWSRSHHEQARVLLYGAADFGHEEWSATARRRLASRQALVAEAIDALATKLGLGENDGRERTTLATIDLPLALVRRHLSAGEPVPAGAERLIEPAVRALLSLP